MRGSPLPIALVIAASYRMGASDIHLSSGSPILVRVDGRLLSLPEVEAFPAISGPLGSEAISGLLSPLLRPGQWEAFQQHHELDASIDLPELPRIRANLFRQRGSVGAVLRLISRDIPRLETLGGPRALSEFARLSRGLVLVTGPTGSGKSSTLAAIVDEINRSRPAHIITIEDPIEYVHRNQRGLVNQREVGIDTLSFASGLRHALRQDPDVILVGELRDPETITVAITAAETGHLVLGTLHTVSAAATVDRIIDAFPGDQQAQIRSQLASTIAGVVSQALLPASRGGGRRLVAEVMLASSAIRMLIREGKSHQIPGVMLSGAEQGMTLFDRELATMTSNGELDYSVAADVAQDRRLFAQLVGRGA